MPAGELGELVFALVLELDAHDGTHARDVGGGIIPQVRAGEDALGFGEHFALRNILAFTVGKRVVLVVAPRNRHVVGRLRVPVALDEPQIAELKLHRPHEPLGDRLFVLDVRYFDDELLVALGLDDGLGDPGTVQAPLKDAQDGALRGGTVVSRLLRARFIDDAQATGQIEAAAHGAAGYNEAGNRDKHDNDSEQLTVTGQFASSSGRMNSAVGFKVRVDNRMSL